MADPAGDFIDRGLAIRRRLEEAGFELRLSDSTSGKCACGRTRAGGCNGT
jgi:hypothetical protein